MGKLRRFRPETVKRMVNKHLSEPKYRKYKEAVMGVLADNPTKKQQDDFSNIVEMIDDGGGQYKITPGVKARLIPVMSALLESHPDENIRWRASNILQGTIEPKVISALRKALMRDPSSNVRTISANVIGLRHPSREEHAKSIGILARIVQREVRKANPDLGFLHQMSGSVENVVL